MRISLRSMESRMMLTLMLKRLSFGIDIGPFDPLLQDILHDRAVRELDTLHVLFVSV